ncbi:MAG: hypothetical protein ABIG69_03430 [Bacteroidota bacterium]|nr:hypothetical protein [Patescibacteria group bacterium]
MENIGPNKETSPEIDLDDVARQYAENLRSEISELKEKEADPHLEKINPSELIYEDLIIYDKAKKYQLSHHEFQSYLEGLRQFFKEQSGEEKKKKADELRNKFKNKEITSEKFDEEFRKLLREEDDRRKKEGKDYVSVSQTNSRSNFAAMIKNKLMAEEDIGRHFDNPKFG